MKTKAIRKKLNSRIRQGESSSSNPNVMLHRKAARSLRKNNSKARRMFCPTKSQLSSLETDKSDVNSPFLSVAPAGVFIGLNPQRPVLQKFVNIALDTCNDILREKLPEDISDSFCAYFTALYPLLESTRSLATELSNGDNENWNSQLHQVTGIVYPLSVVMKKVPVSVILRHWGAISKQVHELLSVSQSVISNKISHGIGSEDECEENDPVSSSAVLLLRSLLSMLSRLLYVRASVSNPDDNEWRPPNGLSANLYATLFHFLFHSKPRIRKIAHASVVKISSVKHNNCYVVSNQTADLLLGAMKRASSEPDSSESMLRRCLALLRDVATSLPSNSIKTLAEMLLSFTILGSHTVRLLSYGALCACCANNSNVTGTQTSLAESLAAALMSDFRPPALNSSSIPHFQITIYTEWLRCVQVCHMAVLNKNLYKALIALPRLIESIFNVFISVTTLTNNIEEDSCNTSARNKLNNLSCELLETWIGVLSQLCDSKGNDDNYQLLVGVVNSVAKLLENSLGFENQQSWPQILHFLAHFIRQLGLRAECVKETTIRLLPALAELQLSSGNSKTSIMDLNSTNLRTAIDEVYGAAISSFGPEFVATTVPMLNFRNTIEHLTVADVDSASWFLSLLGRYCESSNSQQDNGNRLEFFIKSLVPLQEKFQQAIKFELTSSPNGSSSPYLTLLYGRIWSTLPAFCVLTSESNPIAVPPAFAKLLGDKLANEPDIRSFVLTSLVRLVESAPSEISRFAKNFLPILFNLHVNNYVTTTDEDGSVIQSIRSWTQNSNAISLQLAQQFMHKSWERLIDSLSKLSDKVEDEISNSEREKLMAVPSSLLDICDALLYRLCPNHVREFLITDQRETVLKLMTNSDNPPLQKRAYRFVERVMEIAISKSLFVEADDSLSDGELSSFVRNEVQPLLAETLAKTSPPARRARLSCLLMFSKGALLTAKGTDENSFYSATLWEAIASLTDVNSRAKIAATKLFSFLTSAIVTPRLAYQLCWPGQHCHEEEVENEDRLSCSLESLICMLLDRLPSPGEFSKNNLATTIERGSAILIAVASVIRQFKNPLVHEHVTKILDKIDNLLLSPQTIGFRKIIRAILSVLLSAMSSLPGPELECLADRFVYLASGIFYAEVHRKALRTHFERLLTKLARKCGVERVASLVSVLRSNNGSGDDKRLRHLKKTLIRSINQIKSQPAKSDGNFSDSSDDENIDNTKGSRVKAVKHSRVGHSKGVNIVENVDEIADTLAPTSALRLAAKQRALSKDDSHREFKDVDRLFGKKPVDLNDEDYVCSDDECSDVSERRQRPKHKLVVSKAKRKQIKATRHSIGGIQPFSYKPFQRNMLNKRRSALYKKRK